MDAGYDSSMSCVYSLSSSADPENIRYVGRTKHNTPERRLATHLSNARNTDYDSHVYRWIRTTEQEGYTVVCTVLEDSLSWEETALREIHYISEFRSQGFDLTNKTDGGDGPSGYVPTAEHRRKVSERHRGKILSPETREKVGAHHRGKNVSENTRQKISESLRGRPWSDARRAAQERRRSSKEN